MMTTIYFLHKLEHISPFVNSKARNNELRFFRYRILNRIDRKQRT